MMIEQRNFIVFITLNEEISYPFPPSFMFSFNELLKN